MHRIRNKCRFCLFNHKYGGINDFILYFRHMKQYSEIITIDPQVRFGKPCVRGMRITVYDILGWLASGMSIGDIVTDFPELTAEDVKAVLAYAADREHKIRIAS